MHIRASKTNLLETKAFKSVFLWSGNSLKIRLFYPKENEKQFKNPIPRMLLNHQVLVEYITVDNLIFN
jgi:hypothetical protein